MFDTALRSRMGLRHLVPEACDGTVGGPRLPPGSGTSFALGNERAGQADWVAVKEYLLRAEDGDFLLISPAEYADALHPAGVACQPVDGWGDYRFRCGETEVAVSFEDPGLQVALEGELDGSAADEVVQVIARRLAHHTGRGIFVVPL